MQPTPGRVSYKGHTSIEPFRHEHDRVVYSKSSMGPIAKSVADLKLLMQFFGDRSMGHGLDCHIPPVDWDLETCNSAPNKDSAVVEDRVKVRAKVKIGWFRCLEGITGYNSAGEESLLKVVAILKKEGYDVEEVDLGDEFEKMITHVVPIANFSGLLKRMCDDSKHGVEVIDNWAGAKKSVNRFPAEKLYHNLKGRFNKLKSFFNKKPKGDLPLTRNQRIGRNGPKSFGYEDMIPVSTNHLI